MIFITDNEPSRNENIGKSAELHSPWRGKLTLYYFLDVRFGRVIVLEIWIHQLKWRDSSWKKHQGRLLFTMKMTLYSYRSLCLLISQESRAYLNAKYCNTALFFQEYKMNKTNIINYRSVPERRQAFIVMNFSLMNKYWSSISFLFVLSRIFWVIAPFNKQITANSKSRISFGASCLL